MKTVAQRITKEALALPRGSRARLASKLLESLDDVSEKERKEIDVAWVEEAERRMRQIESGKVKAIPGAKVLKEARARYR